MLAAANIFDSFWQPKVKLHLTLMLLFTEVRSRPHNKNFNRVIHVLLSIVLAKTESDRTAREFVVMAKHVSPAKARVCQTNMPSPLKLRRLANPG